MAYDTYYPQNNSQEYYPSFEEDEWSDDGEWAHEDVWHDDEPYPFYEQVAMGGPSAMRPQWMIVPGVIVTMMLLIYLGQSVANKGVAEQVVVAETAVIAENPLSVGGASSSFIAPYDNYVLTQGAHGFSYGHMAIDIAAGMGATIKAPIDGEITELYTDQYSNPTLVIENGRYKVMFLHGNYTAVLGQKFKQGDAIGTEGNNGYTMDGAGNLCYGRPGCGYHTHLNVFDKQLGQNTNPLELINN